MTKDSFIDYLKHTYIPELKERIEEDWEIAGRDEDDETDRDVELHFASGRTVTVRRDPELDDLNGESLEKVIDDCICRYLKDIEE